MWICLLMENSNKSQSVGTLKIHLMRLKIEYYKLFGKLAIISVTIMPIPSFYGVQNIFI